MSIKRKVSAKLLRRHGKAAFILDVPQGAHLLDVGCGNASAAYIKALRPDVYYVGVDVGDYNQTSGSKDSMDEYIVTTSGDFAATLASLGRRFDAVVSNHNLEHCEDQSSTLEAMADSLKENGVIYLAFPSEATLRFPKREGTLNFHDDDTHTTVPRWADVKRTLAERGLVIDVAKQRYRPAAYFLAGALFEPFSALRRRIDGWGASWAFWGFESVIWARRSPALRATVR